MSLLTRIRGRLERQEGERAQADLLRDSGLVDDAYYRARYPEAVAGGRDPVDDYLENGAAQARDPNPFFDTAWYLARYPDVGAASLNPLVHYLRSGAAEGRDPGPDFSTAFYAAQPGLASSGMNPLVHFLRYGRAEGRPARPPPHDPLDDYEAAIKTRRGLTGAAPMDHIHFPLAGRPAERDEDGRPLPPLVLAQRIGAPTYEEYAFIGRETRRTILRCLPPGFSFEGARTLDFGCGVGRVLRYFDREAACGEVWGCDIDGPSIRWATEAMSPPFRIFQISEIPTIPLESNSFDLVYAISVFAHIHADWQHWLAEVRRILKPGGTAFVTFMAQTPFEEMLGRSYWDQGPGFGKYVANPFNDWNDSGPMAFHNPEWIKRYWGGLFDIEFVALDGLLEYQSICVMRKPESGPMAAREVPVLRLSTSQAFDSDAVGRISEDHDRDKPYRESFGIDVRRGPAAVRGWVVFRGSAPEGLAIRVDDEDVPSETRFKPGRPYRDWAGALQTSFTTDVDFGDLPAGKHRLEVRVTSAAGKLHVMSIPLLLREA